MSVNALTVHASAWTPPPRSRRMAGRADVTMSRSSANMNSASEVMAKVQRTPPACAPDPPGSLGPPPAPTPDVSGFSYDP